MNEKQQKLVNATVHIIKVSLRAFILCVGPKSSRVSITACRRIHRLYASGQSTAEARKVHCGNQKNIHIAEDTTATTTTKQHTENQTKESAYKTKSQTFIVHFVCSHLEPSRQFHRFDAHLFFAFFPSIFMSLSLSSLSHAVHRMFFFLMSLISHLFQPIIFFLNRNYPVFQVIQFDSEYVPWLRWLTLHFVYSMCLGLHKYVCVCVCVCFHRLYIKMHSRCVS